MQDVWHDVRVSLIIYLSEAFNEKLPDDLAARSEESVTLSDPGEDLLKFEFRNSNFPEETHRWIEIKEAGGRLVTVIEILSPANKTPAGRRKFDDKLAEFWKRGVSTVEIDLIRGGTGAAAARGGSNWPAEEHQIIVTRRGRVSHHEVYPCPLREPLPVFRIPLRRHEPDLLFDLQPSISRCYEKGRYWLLNVAADPCPALREEDLAWAREILSRGME